MTADIAESPSTGMEVVAAGNGALIGFQGIQTADDVAGAYLAGYGESTRKSYGRDLRHWGAWLASIGVDVLGAHRVHADAYLRECEAAGASPATLARRLSAVSGFYAYAVDEDLIARNPIGRVRRPRVSDESPRVGLEREEVGRLIAAAASSSPRDYALACLLTLNGLRISEALALDASDLSWERGHRTIALTRKGGKRATAPLAPRTADAIHALLAGREEGPIFATRTGKRLDRQAAWKVIRRLALAAGIAKTISPHSCRHGWVTLALDSGVALHVVQDGAGHADPRTTQRYNRHRKSLDNHATYAVAAFVA